MKKTMLGLAIGMTWVVTASGQTITGLTVDKAQTQAGQTVHATVTFDKTEQANCGLRFYWGDGVTQDIKVVDDQQLPLKLQHVYGQPGSYSLMAEGKKVTSHLKCQGANARATVVVLASVAGALPAATGGAVLPPAQKTMPAVAAKPAAGALCPDGWKLNAKSVNKKTGAFTCTAKAGTPVPEKKLTCTGDAGYFENSKKGQLGCRV